MSRVTVNTHLILARQQQYTRYEELTAKDFRRAQFNSLSFTHNANAQLVLVVALLLVSGAQTRQPYSPFVLISLSRKQVILSAPIGPWQQAPHSELSTTALRIMGGTVLGSRP